MDPHRRPDRMILQRHQRKKPSQEKRHHRIHRIHLRQHIQKRRPEHPEVAPVVSQLPLNHAPENHLITQRNHNHIQHKVDNVLLNIQRRRIIPGKGKPLILRPHEKGKQRQHRHHDQTDRCRNAGQSEAAQRLDLPLTKIVMNVEIQLPRTYRKAHEHTDQ